MLSVTEWNRLIISSLYTTEGDMDIAPVTIELCMAAIKVLNSGTSKRRGITGVTT